MTLTRYKKQLRAYINPPALPGMNCEPRPFSEWIDEDDITNEMLLNWENEIKKKDYMSSLIMKERFIKI